MPVDTFYAEQKPIERVGLGSWVQTWGDDGSESWMEVRAIVSGTHGESGRKATFLQGIDLSGELAELREWNNTPVTVIHKTKVKRAGLRREDSDG